MRSLDFTSQLNSIRCPVTILCGKKDAANLKAVSYTHLFRSVYELAGCKKPMKRLWISSMEDSAIREGFANLRPSADYDGLRDAALCRAKADWLVGINAVSYTHLYCPEV